MAVWLFLAGGARVAVQLRGMCMRERKNEGVMNYFPIQIGEEVHDGQDAYLIGQIAQLEGLVFEHIFQLADDRYIWLIIVADDGQSFGSIESGIRSAMYVSKDFALALRSAWGVGRDDQPSLELARRYFEVIASSAK